MYSEQMERPGTPFWPATEMPRRSVSQRTVMVTRSDGADAWNWPAPAKRTS